MLAADEPFVDWSWVADHTEEINEALRQHVQLTVTSVAIGFVISLVLGLVAVRWRWTYEPLAGICSVMYAIPSLALFAVLVSIPFFGLGYRTSLVALVSYTLLILLRNIVAGLDGVPPAVREASDGMGYERWRRVLRVDLPLATPSIVAGLRIATVTTVGLVTVTALVGEGGFGRLINDGLSRDFSTPIVVGTVGSVALAITFDLAFVMRRVAHHAVDAGQDADGVGVRPARPATAAGRRPPRPQGAASEHSGYPPVERTGIEGCARE